jgi:hypothetical protein
MSDNVIHVPQPPQSSFNRHRLLERNLLLKKQVEHFRHVEAGLPLDQQTGIDPQSVRTEGQAGEYIRKMTAILHPAGARKEKVRSAT